MLPAWKPKTKPLPKPQIDLRERLHWVKYKRGDDAYLWPAVLYSSFDEFQRHLQDRIDNDIRRKIAVAILRNFTPEKEMMVARLLGRGMDFIQIMEGEEYFTYTDALTQIMSTATKPEAWAKHLPLYESFMGALDESLSILGGQKQNQWLEIGKERLRSYQSSVQSLNMAGAGKATKEVQNTPTAANKTVTMGGTNTDAISETPTDDKSLSDNSTEHPSSSATIVSYNTETSIASADAEEDTVSPKINIEENDSLQDISDKLLYAGWQRQMERGHIHHFPPGAACEVRGIDGQDYFSESKLRDYLIRTFQWVEPEKDALKLSYHLSEENTASAKNFQYFTPKKTDGSETEPRDVGAPKMTDKSVVLQSSQKTPKKTNRTLHGETDASNAISNSADDKSCSRKAAASSTSKPGGKSIEESSVAIVANEAQNTSRKILFLEDNTEKIIIEPGDNLNSISAKLHFTGWEKRKIDGELFHFFPGVRKDTGTRGKNYFNEEELREYLKRTYQWIEKAKRAPRSSKKASRQKPTRKTPTRTTPSRPRKTPSRPTPSRSKRNRTDEKDEFYSFKILIRFLQDHLDWQYKPAKNRLKQWSYINGHSKEGEDGTYLLDYFHEEDEVIEFCKLNKFKTRFGHLADETEKSKGKRVKMDYVAMGPKFVTPPRRPSRRRGTTSC